MSLAFQHFDPSGSGDLASFLSSEEWPFHAGAPLTYEEAVERIEQGEFSGPGDRTYWIRTGEAAIGLIALHDVGDGTPLFAEFPELRRIEATTRSDNVAMRRVLARCGYVKEAHYRQDWPEPGDGDVERRLDSIGYAILRSDWTSGTRTEVQWEDEPGGDCGKPTP